MEKEHGHYWFLVRGLTTARTIHADFPFDTADGAAFTTRITLQFSQLDGPVTVSITPR